MDPTTSAELYGELMDAYTQEGMDSLTPQLELLVNRVAPAIVDKVNQDFTLLLQQSRQNYRELDAKLEKLPEDLRNLTRLKEVIETLKAFIGTLTVTVEDKSLIISSSAKLEAQKLNFGTRTIPKLEPFDRVQREILRAIRGKEVEVDKSEPSTYL